MRTSGKLAVYTSSPLLPPRGNPASMAANATWAPAKECTLNGVYVPGVGIRQKKKKNKQFIILGRVFSALLLFILTEIWTWYFSKLNFMNTEQMVAEKGQCIQEGCKKVFCTLKFTYLFHIFGITWIFKYLQSYKSIIGFWKKKCRERYTGHLSGKTVFGFGSTHPNVPATHFIVNWKHELLLLYFKCCVNTCSVLGS